MRNYGYGTIDITGVPVGSTVVQAFLYWEILNEIESSDMRIGTFEGTGITGLLIANTGDPCWPPTDAWVYRADVTSLIQPGINGAYSLTGFASGTTDGTNPWDGGVPPLLEGATLVIVYKNSDLPRRTIQIYDGGVTFWGQDVYTTLRGFVAGESPNAKTTYVIADGQKTNAPGPNDAIWNGVVIINDAFPGSDVVDNTGASNTVTGWLWDTVTTSVSVSTRDTSAIAGVSANLDCLTWVAQVFQVDTPIAVGGEIIPFNNLIVIAPWILTGLAALVVAVGLTSKKRLLH